LVELGANVNAQNNLTGATPLHMVAQSNKASIEARIQVVDVLIGAGARPDQMDKYGSLPAQLLELSSEGKELDGDTTHLLAKLRPQQPKIHKSIIDGNLSTLENLLLDESLNVNLTFQGQTPLSLVITIFLEKITDETASPNLTSEMVLPMIKVLITKGADPNCYLLQTTDVSEDKEPVLHKLLNTLRDFYRMTNDSDGEQYTISILNQIIELLLKAEVNISNDTKLLLHQAARFNECTFATFMMNILHVDPNTKGRQGMTPLHFAARSGKVEMLVRT
jgi:ankyrin repeat protein